MDEENLIEFQCAYCSKIFKQAALRLFWGFTVDCASCKKTNHVYVATYQEAWAQIMPGYEFPGTWDPEA